jgi:hypothetical protein
MTRLRDWPSRFAALVDESRARPFEWGQHDCCLWAASAVEAITGRDPGAQWRGAYDDARGALDFLEFLGGLEGAGAMTGKPLSVGMAFVGDVGLVTWPDGTESLAVCSGHDWMCAGEDGLIQLPIECARAAWGVGRV